MEVSSPQRVVAQAASLWRRFVAKAIDTALVLAPVGAAHALNTHIFVLGVFAAMAISIYNDLYLVRRTGQSLGMRLLQIQLLDRRSMKPPGLWQILWRGFVGNVGLSAFRPPYTLATLLTIWWPVICYGAAVRDRRWHRGVHDRWSGTVVLNASAQVGGVPGRPGST